MKQGILKFVWNHKKKWLAKEILRQNDRRVVLPDFKLYYKAVLIKQYGIAIKNGHKNHWNRIEMPEINPNICGQSIYDKKVEIIASGKDCLFKNGVVKAGWLHAKEWNWKTLTPFTKINSKWIKDLIISPEAIKILEEGLPCGCGKESTHQCRRLKCDPWSRKIPDATEQLSPFTTTVEPVL